MKTVYTGFIAGITPHFLSLENKKEISQCWLARDVELTFKDEQLTDIKLVWNSYRYTTVNCQMLKANYYQLKLHAFNGAGRGWDDRAFLWFFKNDAGIVVNGDWEAADGVVSEVWGRFQKQA